VAAPVLSNKGRLSQSTLLGTLLVLPIIKNPLAAMVASGAKRKMDEPRKPDVVAYMNHPSKETAVRSVLCSSNHGPTAALLGSSMISLKMTLPCTAAALERSNHMQPRKTRGNREHVADASKTRVNVFMIVVCCLLLFEVCVSRSTNNPTRY
jgi:hypothetical protein